MKKTALLFLIAGAMVACNSTSNQEQTEAENNNVVETAEVTYDYFGDSTFSTDGAIPSDKLIAFMEGKDSVEATVSGTVESVCKKKGCWMNVTVDDGSSMHVTYNYEFLLPLNCDGREFVMNGYAYYDTIPVSHLKHLAEDAGKSEEEIEQITESKATLAYLATGVMMKK